MGIAKRLWEEEQARRYSSTDKFVCARCFDDYAIKDFIKANASVKQCSFCSHRNPRKNIAAPGNAVLEFILRGIDSEYDDADSHALPYDSEEGEYMVPIYNIFDIIYEQHPDISSDDAVLSWIGNSISDGCTWCHAEPAILSREEGLVAGWEDFCEQVKHKTRYLYFDAPPDTAPGELSEPGTEPFYVHPSRLLEELAELVNTARLIRDLRAGTPVFRARQHDEGVAFATPDELGPPPADAAKAGRMNAAGIVVFYGALEEPTALAETSRGKPWVSIGTFELVKPIRILDLTDLPPVPSIFDVERRGKRLTLRFLRRFCADVSEPIVPDDRIHIEYTPTQVISEFIKLRFRDKKGNRVDGMLYPSSRNGPGRNIVLFANGDNIEGVRTHSYREPTKMLRLSSYKTILVEKLVRALAYQLYEQRGRIDGFALNDWLRAEAQILGEQHPL